MPKLNWKLLTKKRGSSTQGLPPGKEDLAWVTNTVTLLYGERDAILVDTFLSVQHSKELLDWVAESGKNLKGRLLGFVLRTIGRSVLEKAFVNSVKAIEARNVSDYHPSRREKIYV